ncbi:MAG: NAD-dependent malic enzyme, partial [Clostridia bacterium]|nr:NAD-dependent malic enzyme [Clostridia bacterium]
CDIPVFHDDQHGTAIVTLAGLTNALKITGRTKETTSIVMSGAGAAGGAICMLLQLAGFKNIVMSDKDGVLWDGDDHKGNPMREYLAKTTNPEKKKGTLKDVLPGADVFIGVSAPNLLKAEDIATMAKDPIIFACANPTPEIMPDEAIKGGARIVATGRSDFANQINNVLVFPGVFRGAMDVRAKDINNEMKLAAAKALADMVSEEDLANGIIIPKATDRSVGAKVAEAVAKAARETGVARR